MKKVLVMLLLVLGLGLGAGKTTAHAYFAISLDPCEICDGDYDKVKFLWKCQNMTNTGLGWQSELTEGTVKGTIGRSSIAYWTYNDSRCDADNHLRYQIYRYNSGFGS